MKKTIAAILVTLLASAGYVVLDKTAADKIDALSSQVASQQSVISRLQADDPLPEEMVTGDTMRCYPQEKATVMAYYLDVPTTQDWTATGTSVVYWMTERETSAGTTAAMTTTTKSHLPEEPAIPLTEHCTTAAVQAQADEATSMHDPASTTITTTTTTTTTRTARPYDPPQPTGRRGDYNYYTSLEPVTIERFTCAMYNKAPSSIPAFSITLRGKTDPRFAGKTVRVEIGESGNSILTAYDTIAQDGSFTVHETVRLINRQTIALQGIFID